MSEENIVELPVLSGITKFYRDANGVYLGAWESCEPDFEGAIEVSHPPEDARQVWTGNGWGPVPPVVERKPTIDELLAQLRDLQAQIETLK